MSSLLVKDRDVDQSVESEEQSCLLEAFPNIPQTMWAPQVQLGMLADSWETVGYEGKQ